MKNIKYREVILNINSSFKLKRFKIYLAHVLIPHIKYMNSRIPINISLHNNAFICNYYFKYS